MAGAGIQSSEHVANNRIEQGIRVEDHIYTCWIGGDTNTIQLLAFGNWNL